MKALESIPVGFAPSEPWPAHPHVEVRAARSNEVLVAVPAGKSHYWALNPYSGCEFACVWCRARHEVPFRDADPRLFERDIHLRSNAVEAVTRALKDGSFAHAPLVLGTGCDPWQPVEQKARLTRSVLDVLARWGAQVDLRCQTRSTLVPRDADLLLAIARNGRASVCFSLPTQDLKLARLLEPLAPSPDRRLIALETLARAGVRVGVQVAPVLNGLNDVPASLERLLRRARDAGASYAMVAPLAMDEVQRAKMVRFVAHYDPEKATRYDRLLARSVEADPSFAPRLEAVFAAICERLGLAHRRVRREPGVEAGPGPRQLSLF
jgi:DNA repair photolyase